MNRPEFRRSVSPFPVGDRAIDATRGLRENRRLDDPARRPLTATARGRCRPPARAARRRATRWCGSPQRRERRRRAAPKLGRRSRRADRTRTRRSCSSRSRDGAGARAGWLGLSAVRRSRSSASAGMSNVAIAAALGVGQMTVGRDLATSSNDDVDAVTFREGRRARRSRSRNLAKLRCSYLVSLRIAVSSGRAGFAHRGVPDLTGRREAVHEVGRLRPCLRDRDGRLVDLGQTGLLGGLRQR